MIAEVNETAVVRGCKVDDIAERRRAGRPGHDAQFVGRRLDRTDGVRLPGRLRECRAGPGRSRRAVGTVVGRSVLRHHERPVCSGTSSCQTVH